MNELMDYIGILSLIIAGMSVIIATLIVFIVVIMKRREKEHRLAND